MNSPRGGKPYSREPYWKTNERTKHRNGAAIAVLNNKTTDDDNKAILQKAENPAAGRLIFMSWGAGSKCIPEFKGDKR